MRVKTEQEEFWEGQFGTEYIGRNLVQSREREPFFSMLLDKILDNEDSDTFSDVFTVCELGANVGHNLLALKASNGALDLTGVELNASAFSKLSSLIGIHAVHSAIQDFTPTIPEQFDLVFTCGVLIHLNPDDLPAVYHKLFSTSKRYILLNEYFNPTPMEIAYHGHNSVMFKRDFAGEMLELFAGQLNVIDYGFLWKRIHPAWDNTTWVLMEKVQV